MAVEPSRSMRLGVIWYVFPIYSWSLFTTIIIMSQINIRFSLNVIRQFIFSTESTPGCSNIVDSHCNIQLMITDDISTGVDVVASYVERFAYHDDVVVYVNHRKQTGKQNIHVEDIGYNVIGCFNDDEYDMYRYCM